jgi:hypothetical protein
MLTMMERVVIGMHRRRESNEEGKSEKERKGELCGV